MAISTVFRSTPQLGPALTAHDSDFWFNPPTTNTNDDVDVSYMLGNPEKGTDGHVYVMVLAGAGHNAGDPVDINETTWTTSDGDSTSLFEVPDDIEGGSVESGDYFHARRLDL